MNIKIGYVGGFLILYDFECTRCQERNCLVKHFSSVPSKGDTDCRNNETFFEVYNDLIWVKPPYNVVLGCEGFGLSSRYNSTLKM